MGGTDGEKIISELKSLKYDDVILDLRSNYGETPSFASEYVYPYLFSETFSVSSSWYMPCTEQNNGILDNIYIRIALNPRKTTESLYFGDYDFNEISSEYIHG